MLAGWTEFCIFFSRALSTVTALILVYAVGVIKEFSVFPPLAVSVNLFPLPEMFPSSCDISCNVCHDLHIV